MNDKTVDALKQSAEVSQNPQRVEDLLAPVPQTPDRRRTTRARVEVPLMIYGYDDRGSAFFENAHTLGINAHGALIAMKTPVPMGERLLLTNALNQRTEDCMVLSVTPGPQGVREVAVSFLAPAPRFWRKSGADPS